MKFRLPEKSYILYSIFSILLVRNSSSITLPSKSAKIFRSSHLRSINYYRSKHIYTKNLYVSRQLTQKSQEFAEYLADYQKTRRNVEHDPKLTPNQGLVGENLFLDQASKYELGLGNCRIDECRSFINSRSSKVRKYLNKLGKKAATNWYSTQKLYNYHSTKCGRDRYQCEHFTQLVWRGTKYLGLGIAFNEDRDDPRFLMFYVVTRFSPRGNFVVKYHKETFEDASLREYRDNVKRLIPK